MKREDLRCGDCNAVYLSLQYGDGHITVTHYSGHKLAHSDGNGNASKHNVHRREYNLDLVEDLRAGGMPTINVECRCRVRQVNLQAAIGDLYRR